MRIDGGELVFGAATELTSDNGKDDRASFIFVLLKRKDGKLSEVVHSKRFFGVRDALVDSIDAQSTRRFTVQISGHSYCGRSVHVYRFAKIRQRWEFTGRDDTTCQCHDGDAAVCQSRNFRSANFITGNFVKQEFIRDKKVSEKRKTYRFKRILLDNFENDYDTAYWEQL